MTRSSPRDARRLFALAFGVCLLLASSQAATPALAQSPLAALVPDDVGLVIEGSRLARDLDLLASGPLGKRLRAYPPFAAWWAQHEVQIGLYAAQVREHLGATPRELTEILLGQEVLVAIWPETAATQPGEAPMILLFETADAARLQELFVRTRETVARAGGQFKIHQQQAGSHQVTVCSISRGQPGELHLAAVGSLALASNSMPMLRRVLALCSNDHSSASPLAALPAYRAAHQQLPTASLRLFVNPRAWDPLVAQPDPAADAHAQRDRQIALQAWQAIRYVAASLKLDEPLRAALAVCWQEDALPAPLGGALCALRGRAHFIRRIPSDAVVAAAGWLDVRQLVQALLPYAAAASEQGGRTLAADTGTTLLVALASYLGPEVVAYVIPLASHADLDAWHPDEPHTRAPDAGGKARQAQDVIPPAGNPAALAWVVGLRTQVLDEPSRQPLAAMVLPLLRTALHVRETLLGDHAQPQVRTDEFQGLRVTTVELGVREGADPARLELSFTAQEEVLWAASQRWALEQALELPGETSLERAVWWAELVSPQVAEPGQFLYVNLAALRAVLRRLPHAVDLLLGVRPNDTEAARRSRQELLALASLCDRLLIAGTVNEQGLVVSLTIMADENTEASEK